MSTLKLGKLVHNSLNYIHSQITVTLHLYDSQIRTLSGRLIPTYTTVNVKARMNPISDNLELSSKSRGNTSFRDDNIEIGVTYREFYILVDFLATLNRNLNTAGDYIETPDGMFYRIRQIPESFQDGWQRVIGIQSLEIGS